MKQSVYLPWCFTACSRTLRLEQQVQGTSGAYKLGKLTEYTYYYLGESGDTPGPLWGAGGYCTASTAGIAHQSSVVLHNRQVISVSSGSGGQHPIVNKTCNQTYKRCTVSNAGEVSLVHCQQQGQETTHAGNPLLHGHTTPKTAHGVGNSGMELHHATQ